MTRIIMCGCNGKMGRVISQLVKEDENAEIVAGVDISGEQSDTYPVFKKITGKNLHHAIFEERIRLSCKWLTQTTRSIEDIAFSTGFSSRSHFCTIFKEHTGVSPLKYRSNQSHK